MAYEPTVWKDGDIITADLLNKLENGVENEQVGPAGPQGPQGIAGETGLAAGFGTVSATIDSNIGQPSVSVFTAGPDTAKEFTFTFKNLKGEKGDKGDKGEPGSAASITYPISVENGGTGTTSLSQGEVLIGSGTSEITTRAITDNTSTSESIPSSTNLVTANTVANAINRTSSVASADTSYSTFMARGIAAGTESPSRLENGCIFLVYE